MQAEIDLMLMFVNDAIRKSGNLRQLYRLRLISQKFTHCKIIDYIRSGFDQTIQNSSKTASISIENSQNSSILFKILKLKVYSI